MSKLEQLSYLTVNYIAVYYPYNSSTLTLIIFPPLRFFFHCKLPSWSTYCHSLCIYLSEQNDLFTYCVCVHWCGCITKYVLHFSCLRFLRILFKKKCNNICWFVYKSRKKCFVQLTFCISYHGIKPQSEGENWSCISDILLYKS